MENIPRDIAWARFSLPRKCHSDHIKCIRQSMSVFITTHISIVWSGKKEITVAFSQQHTHNTRWDVTLEICSVWPSDFPYSYHPFRIPFIFHFFYFKAPKLTLSGYVGGGGLHRWFIVPCWEMCGALLTIPKTWSKWRLSGIAPYFHVPGERILSTIIRQRKWV